MMLLFAPLTSLADDPPKPESRHAACLLQGGKNLEKSGKPERALENHRSVVELHGGSPFAKQAAERIKALTGK
jgi:hypothetical protein